MYAGDFNCWHTDWGYKTTNQDGESMAEWLSSADAVLLFNPKEPHSFISGRWDTETNPDLAFAKIIRQEPLPVRRVLDRFPRSQHLPSLITTPSLIQSTEGKPVRRWNFRKANWTDFTADFNTATKDLPVPTASNIDEAYEAYCNTLQDAAKKHVLWGVRKNYVLCWDEECDDLLRVHNDAKSNAERARAATDLMTRLNTKRRERWTETVESIDFTHFRRRAWQTINKLTGQASKTTPCPITANAIAAQLISNGRFPDAGKAFTRKIMGEVYDLRRAPSADANLSGDFTSSEIKSAIKHLKPNKAAGIDNIHPEFILHQGSKATEWLRLFCSVCYRTSKLPKIWWRAKIIALPEARQADRRPKRLPSHLTLVRAVKDHGTSPTRTPRPGDRPEAAEIPSGFRRGKSTVDQVTLLTQDIIEDTFQRGEKAGVVLLDLTAAYDTVWLRRLHLKLLQTILDRYMVGFIMEMLSNRSFTLHTSDGQHSRLRKLKNGVPQGSVLAPMLFNIYIHDIPDTQSKKYGYADDLAIMLSHSSWETIESGLTADMGILSTYLKNWRLKLSVAKTMSSAFHLNNREASHELNIKVNNRLQFQGTPTYLGVKLDRTLMFRQHLENLSAKTMSRVALIRRLAGTTWGASTKALHISTQALVFSAAEYCAPVWCRSTHTKKLDSTLNNALRTVFGCLRATPANQLPILTGIAPPTLRREASVLTLSRKATNDDDHLLHKTSTETPQRARLKSRRPFAEHCHQLMRAMSPKDYGSKNAGRKSGRQHTTPGCTDSWRSRKNCWVKIYHADSGQRLTDSDPG